MISAFWELAALSFEQEGTEKTEWKNFVSSVSSVGSTPVGARNDLS
jgi:hypothetical protein